MPISRPATARVLTTSKNAPETNSDGTVWLAPSITAINSCPSLNAAIDATTLLSRLRYSPRPPRQGRAHLAGLGRSPAAALHPAHHRWAPFGVQLERHQRIWIPHGSVHHQDRVHQAVAGCVCAGPSASESTAVETNSGCARISRRAYLTSLSMVPVYRKPGAGRGCCRGAGGGLRDRSAV